MRTLMWGLAGLFVAYVAGCSAISAWHSHALASVPVGASRAEYCGRWGNLTWWSTPVFPLPAMPAVDAVVAVRSDGGMRTGWAWIPKPGR
jgi:hypothetical protein